MNAEPEIRRGRKFDQVVEGAAAVFMREGFEGASVSTIAREAGVSKATLYSYFPDKKLLFIEVACREIARQAEITLAPSDHAAPPREILTRIGRNFTSLIMSPFGLSIMRVVIAEAERFPEVGRTFFETGPKLMEDRMVTYFEAAEARGELDVPDKPFAAHQFIELCKAGCHMRALMGLGGDPTPDEIDHVVRNAVDMFLARYGTTPAA